jgi:Carbohydrate esterase, sialic acid-specific acetylesterase
MVKTPVLSRRKVLIAMAAALTSFAVRPPRRRFAFARNGSSSPAPTLPNGTITVAARGSVYFNGTDSGYSYADSASFDFPDGDWFLATLVRIKRGRNTRYIASIGAQGGTHNVQLYLATNQLACQVRAAGSTTTITQTGTTTINDGWYVVVVQRNGTNIELLSAPLSGTATVIGSAAMANPGAITPTGTHTVGVRSSSNTGTWWWNFISWVAKGSGTLSLTDIANLAAGQDIKDDLARSLSVYTRFDAADATLTDQSGNGNTASRTGSPATRGGPDLAGLPVRIDDATVTPTWGYVFQRTPGGTSRPITFTGAYTGSPSELEARVIKGTATAVTSWTDCTTPNAGVWNVTIDVPQGRGYALEVRHKDTPSRIQRTGKPWGVGLRLLAAGESLCDQWTTSAGAESGYTTLEDDISIYNPRLSAYWDNVGNPACAANLASRLTAALDLPVMILGAGYSGTALVADAPTNWGTYTSDMHTRTLAAIAGPGGGADFESIIWVQGVNDGWDTNEIVSVAQYQTALEALIPKLRTYAVAGRTAAQNPAFITITGRITTSPFAPGNFRNVRTAQQNAIATITNARHGGSCHDLTLADSAHPDANGFILMGKRIGQGILNYYLPGTYTTGANGPEITSASITATDTIDVVLTLNGAATVRGKTGATALNGFVVKNGGGTVQTISATAIPAANTIRLTVAGAAAGYTVEFLPDPQVTITNLPYGDLPCLGVSGTDTIPVKPGVATLTV